MLKDLDNNLKQFQREVDDFAKKLVPEKVVLFQKKLVFEAFKRLVLKTPVDTGRARGNWIPTIGQPATEAIKALDPSGNETIKKCLAMLANLPPYNIVWLSNNVDYIEYLEDGSSQQAPEGMMSLTIAELSAMFSRAQD